MGYKLAGYKVIGNVEIDPRVMKVYKTNNHPDHSFLMDIRDFLKLEDLPEQLFNLDILDGSPPCSVFSMSGDREKGWNTEKVFREGQKKQRLDDLFFYFIDVAERLKPKVVVAENVAGLLRGNAKGYVNKILHRFDEVGYDVQIFLLNSATMGVPQKRERCFFIARRKDLELPKLTLSFNEKPIMFGEVRTDHGKPIDPVRAHDTKEMLRYYRPGDHDIAEIKERVKGKGTNYNTKINEDNRIAFTLVSGSTYVRACDKTWMSDGDIVNVQTFPQDYDFCGQTPIYICGMSVPPVMMANITGEIYNQWLKSCTRAEDSRKP